MSGPSFLNLLKVQAPNIMNNTQQSKLIAEIHEAWATAHGYRTKVQAPSTKRQAASAKLQATSAKRQAPSSKLKNIIESLLDRGP